MSQAEKALEVATKAHFGQKDKAGKDYILHPIMVASFMESDSEKAVAYLHDVVEDTNVTLDDLRNIFTDEVVNAVEAITKRKNEPYDDYLKRVSSNKIARKVKVSDLLHNSDLTRLQTITEKDIKRVNKYKRGIIYLFEHSK